MDELCELLEMRARKINKQLHKHFLHAPVAEFLKEFNKLHQKHLAALRAGRVIVAHEVLVEICEPSYALSHSELKEELFSMARYAPAMSAEFTQQLGGGPTPRRAFPKTPVHAVRPINSAAKSEARKEARTGGQLVQMYVKGGFLQVQSDIVFKTENISAIQEWIVKEYARFTALSFDENGDGPQVDLPSFAAAFDDADEYTWRQATAVFRKIRRTAVPAFVAALGDPAQDVRQSAAKALAKIGPATADTKTR